MLLARARDGDSLARDQLAVRYLEVLRRFAHGRLPAGARTLKETDDLVQDTVLRGLEQVSAFVPRREGAFLAYLRQIVLNQVRDEVRRLAHKMPRSDMVDELPGAGTSPLEQAIGREAVELYERALTQLEDQHREAVVLRIEMGFSYEQIAEALEKPTPNAARMCVQRALKRVAELMKDLREMP